jgi:V-type H+-transporting ATPase subunit a
LIAWSGYFRAEIEKEGIPMRPSSEFENTLAAPMSSEIDELVERSGSLEQRITSLKDNYEHLRRREVSLIERRWVLREAGGFFDRVSTFSLSGPMVVAGS